MTISGERRPHNEYAYCIECKWWSWEPDPVVMELPPDDAMCTRKKRKTEAGDTCGWYRSWWELEK